MERRLAEDFFAALRSDFEMSVAAGKSDDICVVFECFGLLLGVWKHKVGRERLNGLEKKVFQCHSCVFCEVRGRNDLGTLWRLIGNIVNRFWMRVAHLGSLLMMWVQVNFG